MNFIHYLIRYMISYHVKVGVEFLRTAVIRCYKRGDLKQ